MEVGKFAVSALHGSTIGKRRIEIEFFDTDGLAINDEDVTDKMQSEGVKRVKVVKVPPGYYRESKLAESVSQSLSLLASQTSTSSSYRRSGCVDW